MGYETIDENGEPLFCELIRSIYGLKQSGACWEEELSTDLVSYGLERCEEDRCVYRMQQEGYILIVAVYVDDIIIATDLEKLRDNFIKNISKKYEVSDQGDLTWVLNAAVNQDLKESTVTLDQTQYAKELVEEYLTDAGKRGRVTPCTDGILNLPQTNESGMISEIYPRIIGKIGWMVAIS